MVLVGGALGSLARYMLGTAILAKFGGRFPFGTFFINLTGSFVIGFAMTWLGERSQLGPNWRLLGVVGFLGGYTTFSSYQWETLSLLREGGDWLAVLNALGSVVAGFGAVWLGAVIAARR